MTIDLYDNPRGTVTAHLERVDVLSFAARRAAVLADQVELLAHNLQVQRATACLDSVLAHGDVDERARATRLALELHQVGALNLRAAVTR